MKTTSNTHKQSGAVSLFVVIFAILLLSVITIGFLRIMTNDQNKATSNDLAQSALDSSQAGVEDAKRALLWYQQNCTGASPAASCGNFLSDLDKCNTSIRDANVVKAGDIKSSSGDVTGEIQVQQSTSNTDKALNQAYTCVTMEVDTIDYVGSLKANQSVLVPLIATRTFNTVTVEWFNRDDVSNLTGNLDTPTPTTTQQLVDTWPANRPSIMRTQFMQTGGSFTLSSFDSTTPTAESNANTVFLYPATNGFPSATMTDRDIRQSPSGNSIPSVAGSAPLRSSCGTNVSSSTSYACKISLRLPTAIGGDSVNNSAYLRLTAMYNGSHFRLTLSHDPLGHEVKFKNVQPIVDSTGRANDVFRRVQSRIDLYDAAFPYPDAAVDTTGELCKDFGVTDQQYIAGSTPCTP